MAVWTLVLAVATAAALAPAASTRAAGSFPTGLSRLLAAYDGADVTRGIATFGAIPSRGTASALGDLGLAVQRMKHVPLAIVQGRVSAMRQAVTGGIASDVYPNERLELFDTESSDAMGAAVPRTGGFTGKGVTVAVVDSGCDASHPDLADRVVHNVKLISAEYANIRPDSSSTIVIANEEGPYQNTDIGSGHGTHVAGIIAADDSSTAEGSPIDGTRLGVAPDAELVCYAIGEILFTTAVVTAYDHLLDQPGLWGVDVVNNSWGNSYRQFDPRDPVAVVTRAVAANGVVVVFAAGNSGDGNAEMGLNPFSEAPWVISVAAGTIDHRRGSFSSNGLRFDNSTPSEIGPGGHTVDKGDRIGVYHPDVTAPGVSISSTCSTAGVAIRACPPPDYTNRRASGTSMASPHVAGAAAVLLQANPALTPAQVRQALQATADPVLVPDDPDTPAIQAGVLAFWQVGYGYVDLAGAVDLVRSKGWATKLGQARSRANARVLGADGFDVRRSDFWTYDAPRVAGAGSDSRTFAAWVSGKTTHLKVTVSHPSLAVLGENGMEYTVTVRDAAGRVLGSTTEAVSGAGTASLFLRIRSISPISYGTFTFEVSGELAVSDPDTLDSESLLGRMVTLQVVQLRRG